MRRVIQALFNDASADTKGKLIGIYALLAAFNIGSWLWAVIAFRHHPLLMGTAFLAYSFGLRHAVDADHIAAIDNVTRKLMQEGKRPVAVGFMFALGHSTVVVLACVGIAITALALHHQIDAIKDAVGIIGTLVSSGFLLVIALINLIVLRSVYKAFQRVRRGEPYVEDDFNMLLADRGFFARIFRPLFNLITRSWHMYPLGFLFGLGFDTATEIGLLSLSATSASSGLPIWSILVFPALFAAGMSLIDATNSILMMGAYGWAYVKPIRKLYYNMTITFFSVVVALVVGSIEALGLLAARWHPAGAFWDLIDTVNDHFGVIGYVIIGMFFFSWGISIAVFKWKKFDDIELNQDVMPARQVK